MPWSKSYYPLFPARVKAPREPVVAFLSISPDDIFTGAGIFDGLTRFDSLDSFGEWLSNLPNKTRIYGFSIDFIGTIFPLLIERYTIEGIGEDALILTIKGIKSKQVLNIVDLFMFFGRGLKESCFKSHLPAPDSTQEQRVKSICDLYRYLDSACVDLWGIHPSMGPGSTALKSYRRLMTGPLYARGKRLRSFFRSAITAGALHWKTGFYPAAWQYDINAAYLYVMKGLPYPVRVYGFSNHQPKHNKWIARVTINYDCKGPFSPLIIRASTGELYHPTKVNNTSVTITYIDYEVLKSFGNVEIVKWIEGVSWSERDEVYLFRDWVNIIETYITANPVNKFAIKTLTRSLHSKFAQNPEMSIVKIIPVNDFNVIKGQDVADFYPLSNGKLAAKIIERKPAEFNPYDLPEYELLTLSAARALIYGQIDSNTVYIDTDCIISTEPREDLIIGESFGAWKLQARGAAYIAGPRVYTIDNRVKAAGISSPDKQDLRQVINGAATGAGGQKTISIVGGRLINPTAARIANRITVHLTKYPQVETRGRLIYVTRSPTKVYTARYPGRFISTNKTNSKLTKYRK